MPEPSVSRQLSAGDLLERMESMERRLDVLEKHTGLVPAQPADAKPFPVEVGLPDASETAKLIPVAGISLLGVAAGSLLRALCEMKTLPLAAGLTLGAAYAFAWLWWASRAASTDGRLAIARALTAVAILAPLAVEAQERYHETGSWTTAAILVALAAAGFSIAWKNSLNAIAWITSLAALLTAGGMLLVTRDLIPFTVVLLVLAAAVEASACFQHWLTERWMVALAANAAVLLTTLITSLPSGVPSVYVPVDRAAVLGVQIALLVIYFASTMTRTLWLGFRITNGEIFRCVTAYGIAAWGTLRIGQNSAEWMVPAFSLLCALACYLVSFTSLERHPEKDRNFYAYATFGILLAVSGSLLAFRGGWLTAIWSAIALLFLAAGPRARRLTLEWHGIAFLALAMAASGHLREAAGRFLTAPGHGSASSIGLTAIAAATSVAGYLLLLSARGGTHSPALIPLGIAAAWGAANIVAMAAVRICECATVLMLVLTGGAVALMFAGRVELRYAAYLLLSVATGKLFLQDLRQPGMLATVISLLLYGGALVIVPRLAVRSMRERTSAVSP